MIGLRRIFTLGGVGLFGLVLACASCGGSSGAKPDGGGGGGGGAGGTGGVTGPTTGKSGCNQLVTVLCNRAKTCNVVPDASAQDVADCVRLQNISYSCDLATASSDFANCLQDVNALSCDSLFMAAGPPASCGTALNMIPLTDPQMKCGGFVTAACQKSATCNGITLSTTDLQSCELDGYQQLGCDLAITVGATYNQCLTDFGNAPCAGAADGGTTDGGGAPIPSCSTAITFAM
jgi:hypothetical protein